MSKVDTNNNQTLKQLMAEHNVTASTLAEISDTSINTIKAWLCKTDAKKYRNLPDLMFEHLKSKIEGKEGKKVDTDNANILPMIAPEVLQKLLNFAKSEKQTPSQLLDRLLNDALARQELVDWTDEESTKKSGASLQVIT